MKQKIMCVIPARYKSSRFPGKPLVDIAGKPMIWWSYRNACSVEELDVVVATDSEQIQNVCMEFNINVVMTSDRHPTGVDRVAEVARKIEADWYLLVQGDEPLLERETILEMKRRIEECPDFKGVRTFRTEIENPIDVVNYTIIKIVTDLEDNVLLASRSAIPYPKNGIAFKYYKSVGVYAYPREILLQYPNLQIGPLEKIEDHDFMRMLENGIAIKAYPWSTNTISVDTPKDVERVRKILEERLNEFDIKG